MKSVWLVFGIIVLIVLGQGGRLGVGLEAEAAAEELIVCDGVYTNLNCQKRRVIESRASSTILKDGNYGSEGSRLDGLNGEPGQEGRRERALSMPEIEELPKAQVLSRAESSRMLAGDAPDDGLNGAKRKGHKTGEHQRVGGRSRRDSKRAQGGIARDRGQRASNGSSGHDIASEPKEVAGEHKGKARLIKMLRAQQSECSLPQCFAALALEEAVERCGSLEVNYSSCRQEAAMVLGKVAKAREQQRRAQFDEDRHRLELERLRQRGIKLSLDEARQRRGDGRRTKAPGD